MNAYRPGIRRRAIMLAVLTLLAAPSLLWADEPSNEGWTSLFNGKNLDGWVPRGGKAKYRAEDCRSMG